MPPCRTEGSSKPPWQPAKRKVSPQREGKRLVEFDGLKSSTQPCGGTKVPRESRQRNE